MSDSWRYMPILKWKRGEQDALRYLKGSEWEGVTPLVELQPIGAAPDAASLKVALPEYLAKVVKEIEKSIPEERAICIDTGYVSSSYAKQVNLLLVVCNFLRKKVPNRIIPVIRATWLELLPALPAVHIDTLKELPAIVLRLRTDQLEPLQVRASVDALAKCTKKRRIHLLLDQYSLVDRQHADCLTAIKPYLNAATASGCASVTLGGGSFPVNLMGRKQGVDNIPRVEWKIWSHLKDDVAYPSLRYADYTVTNPAPLPEDVDAKNMNPSIAIRYASTDFWRLYKGKGFKSGARGELRSLCKLLTTDGIYSGENYSYGDGQYKKIANGGDKNGVPWTWRRDATSHHIVLTANSL